MKLTVQSSTLRDALEIASKPVGKDKTLPVLADVLLEASPDGGLTVTGTDLRTRAYRTVDALVDGAGMVTLPPKALADFLDAVPDGEQVSIVVDATQRATLTCGRTRVTVTGIDPEGYPAAPSLDESSARLTLPSGTFRDLIDSTAFAAARDDSRPVLAGVLITTQRGSGLSFNAADGFRMALRSVLVDGQDADLNLIVSAAGLMRVSSALAKAAGDVRLSADAAHLLIESAAGSWALTCIDGTMPDLRRAMPGSPATVATVERAALMRVVRLVGSILIDSQTSMARIELSADNLSIRSGNAERDHEADVTIDAEIVKGESIVFALNTHWLRDALTAIEAERVAIDVELPMRPILIRDASQTDGRHVQVVMPMQVPNERPS